MRRQAEIQMHSYQLLVTMARDKRMEVEYQAACIEGRGPQACKAHQYAGFTNDRYGGKIFSMLYCRVLPGTALSFKRTGTLASRGWLHGMISPRSGDPVFDAQMRACGLTARAKEAFDSIEVRPRARDESQIHREFVVFDESQVYPEFIVQYRTDTPEEEARLVRKKEREELVSSAFLMTCTNNTTLQLLACLLLLLHQRRLHRR
jgi:hypothetical protein